MRPGGKSPEAKQDKTNRDIREHLSPGLLTVKPGHPIAVRGHDQKGGKDTRNTNCLGQRDLLEKKIQRRITYPGDQKSEGGNPVHVRQVRATGKKQPIRGGGKTELQVGKLRKRKQ